MMNQNTTLKNKLLVSTPLNNEKGLAESVIYIYEHNGHGAKGFIVNQPSDKNLGQIFDYLKLPLTDRHFEKRTVLKGGPDRVHEGFMLYLEDNEITVSQSQSTLKQFCNSYEHHPEDFLFILGNIEWEAEDVEGSLFNNQWLIAPVCEHILFDLPFEQRWQATGSLLGIDNLYYFSREVAYV